MLLLLLVTMGLGSQWPGSYWDIPGQWCSASWPRLQCCQGRSDSCGMAILNCDTFCNRSEWPEQMLALWVLRIMMQDCQLRLLSLLLHSLRGTQPRPGAWVSVSDGRRPGERHKAGQLRVQAGWGGNHCDTIYTIITSRRQVSVSPLGLREGETLRKTATSASARWGTKNYGLLSNDSWEGDLDTEKIECSLMKNIECK